MINFIKNLVVFLCLTLVFAYVFEAEALTPPKKFSAKLRAEISRGVINGKPNSNKQNPLGKFEKINHKEIIFSKPITQPENNEDTQKETQEISIKPTDVKENIESIDASKINLAKKEAAEFIKESEEEIEKENKEKLIVLLKSALKQNELNPEDSDDNEKDEITENKIQQDNVNYINLNKEELVLATGEGDVDKLSFSNDSSPVAKLFLASIQSRNIEIEDSEKAKSQPIKISAVQLVKKPDTLPPPKIIDGIINREYIVKRGDSFSAIFTKMGYDAGFILNLSKILIVDANFNPSKIQFGQKFIFTEKISKDSRTLISLQIPSGLNIIKVQRDKSGKIQVLQGKREVTSKFEYKKFNIRGSLIGSASSAAVPNKVIAQISRVLAQKYDLSSQLSANDLIEILFEKILDKNGKIIDSGKLIYISVKGRVIKTEAFSFDVLGNGKSFEFFDSNSQAFKKSITNNPLNGRYPLTSGYGYRRHPVLGRRMFHAGVDYGAPTGTPIPAAGDGVIVKMGRYGGYGNYIRIKHDGVWQTAYGHMSRFASGMRVWRKVSKGEIIGYVGSTGRSTGPHLHLETLKYGKAVDPFRADLPSGRKLYGKELARYRGEMNRIRQILSVRKANG